MRALRRFLTAVALGAVLTLPVSAEVRKSNIDVIIALDKSLSMVDKVDAVKSWVSSTIVDQMLIPGDTLVIVAFYGKADVVVSQSVTSESDKQTVKSVISGLVGNGHFTDIGNALDVVKAEIAKRENDGREKYVLLLTDGIQEAPHGSKYYSKDGSFNHEFLANTKTIPEKGWKIMILGLGSGTAARDLAGQLNGSYAEVPANASTSTIAATAGTLFSSVTLTQPVRVSGVRQDGSSTLDLSLRAAGLQGDTSVTISGISARYGASDIPSVLQSPVTLTVKGNGLTNATVPVRFPAHMAPGSAWTTLAFSFTSAATFSPSSTVVPVTVNSTLQNNVVPAGAGAIIVLIVVGVGVFLLVRRARGQPLHFAILVDGEPVTEDDVSLGPGKQVFLGEVAGKFSLAPRRTPKSFAGFTAAQGKLQMNVIRADRFPRLKEPPEDLLGKTLTLRTENGRSLPLKIRARERK